LFCAGAAFGAKSCRADYLQRIAAPATHIQTAVHVPASAGVPAHCAVTGFIDNGSRIGFSVGLPDAWNGKFLFLGIGGFAGVLSPIAPGLARGYATATTDTGHQGASLEDARWALHAQGAVVNHYEWGVERTAQMAKSLLNAYYGAVPKHSYFQGCSAGGRQAMVEAERFPSTFDGIVAEAPAWNYSKLLSTFIENGKEILRTEQNWIPPSMFDKIDREVLRQCDRLDGVADGIVMDPSRCHPDLSSLSCKADGDKDCLTAAQLAIIDKLVNPPFAKDHPGYYGFYLTGSDRDVGYSWGWPEWFFGSLPPMRDANGRLNFRPDVLPPGPERGKGPNQFILGEQFFRYMVAGNPAYDARDFELERGAEDLRSAFGDMLDADSTNLGRFVRAGGRLLIWHGWSDPAIPPGMSIDLYERILRDTPRLPEGTAASEAVRLFMVPGVQHCGGGTGLTLFDPLRAMERWVEGGQAPDRMNASQIVDGKPVRTRPLCAYPRSAKYSGAGSTDDASNFVCQ
jgi:feruloyl esterase